MTSKRCFTKIMKEDFKHKMWMLALSVLAHLVMLPIPFMLTSEMRTGWQEDSYYMVSAILRISRYFTMTIVPFGGFVAIVGAMIVGFAGFRYLYHRNMVDTWHSLPIKRRTLFAVTWLNGFIMWFVPAFVSVLLTTVLGVFQLNSLKKIALSSSQLEEIQIYSIQSITGKMLVAGAAKSMLMMLLIFLLVYNTVVLAVMLCGNLLNSMVCTATLGFGTISAYGLMIALCETYLNTFTMDGPNLIQSVLYSSPIASAVVLTFKSVFANSYYPFSYGAGTIIINTIVAIALGILALCLYRKRPSELTGRGIQNRIVKVLLQLVISFCAAVGGWLFFYFVAGDIFNSGAMLAWNVFGALFVGILGFGVLNIVMEMDFKAFFHKLPLMCVVMAAGLLTCFAIRQDITGYDKRLPDKDQIAEIAIYEGDADLNQYSAEYEEKLESLHIKDTEKAYAFLKAAVERIENNKEQGVGTGWFSPEVFIGCSDESKYTVVSAKVTLKNGRSYYRQYQVSTDDATLEAAFALVTTPEYIEQNYIIGEEFIDSMDNISINTYNQYFPGVTMNKEKMRKLILAYNEDIKKFAPQMIKGEGVLYAYLDLTGERMRVSIPVYEYMTTTIEALKDTGLWEKVECPALENVEKFTICLEDWGYRNLEGITKMECAADMFGVYPEEVKELMKQHYDEYGQNGAVSEDFEYIYDRYEELPTLEITDKEEIAEIYALSSYVQNWYSVYRKSTTAITMKESSMGEFTVFIPRGTLPEKYILRFGE